MSPSPPCHLACKISWMSANWMPPCNTREPDVKSFTNFENHKTSSASRQNLFHEFCGLASAWHACRGWYCNLQLLQPSIEHYPSEMFEPLGPLDLFTYKILYEDMCVFLCYNSLLFSNFRLEFRPQLVVVSGLLMGIPLTVGFRPQLLVVSGPLVVIPLTVGFRPQLVVYGLLVGIPLTVGFRLSRSLRLSRSPFHETFLSHNGILAITEPSHKPFFHAMEFRLSWSLLMNFSFIRWNFGYHRAFSQTSLSYDGISAIMEPSHEPFFHTMEFRLSQSLLTNFSFI
jgi:hypothetical protein